MRGPPDDRLLCSRFPFAASTGECLLRQAPCPHVIAGQVIATLLDMFRDAVRTVDDLVALGLRLAACAGISGVGEVRMEAFRWYLRLVSLALA